MLGKSFFLLLFHKAALIIIICEVNHRWHFKGAGPEPEGAGEREEQQGWAARLPALPGARAGGRVRGGEQPGPRLA